MQLNKLLKGLAIALPLFTLAACSSSSDSDASGAEAGMTDGMGGVQTGSANGLLSPEEQMRQSSKRCSATTSSSSRTTVTISRVNTPTCWMPTPATCVSARPSRY